jgi:hypothetical protein
MRRILKTERFILEPRASSATFYHQLPAKDSEIYMVVVAQKFFALVAVASMLVGSDCNCATTAGACSMPSKDAVTTSCPIHTKPEDSTRLCCPPSKPVEDTYTTLRGYGRPAESELPRRCPCDHGRTHVAPLTPDAKFAFPVTVLLTPAFIDLSTVHDHAVSTFTELVALGISRSHDQLTLYALHCSLLD